MSRATSNETQRHVTQDLLPGCQPLHHSGAPGGSGGSCATLSYTPLGGTAPRSLAIRTWTSSVSTLILGLDGSSAFLLVQLKAYGGCTRSWDVHKALLEQGGQVVVARVDYSTEEPAISYHALTPVGRKRALGQAPRATPTSCKCKVAKADLREVKDLMALFEEV